MSQTNADKLLPKDTQFRQALGRSLVWLAERGLGYFPVRPEDYPYDEGYFAKYQRYAETERGRAITAFRVDLVRRHIGEETLVDVGIGCGSFIEARGGQTFGLDINPAGIRWLNRRRLLWDLSRSIDQTMPHASFWDVLEHFPQPEEALARVRGYVFLCVPLFRDVAHVLRSKHYRRDEHYWYWTRDGLVEWFAGQGFELVEQAFDEVWLGREDVGNFVFRRRLA